MFGVIFFRLWYLQVLTGEQYVQEAAANSVRELPIAAPRGQILDREGQPIAASMVTNAVQIVPSALPPAGRPRLAVYRRLGALLGMSAGHIEALVIKGRTALPYAPVTIKTAAGRGRADRARRAPERIPRRHPAAGLDPLLSLRRDGRAGARLRRPGLQKRARKARLPRRPAGDGGRPGRARVLLRPLSARARRRAARAGQLGRLSRAHAPAADAAARPVTASVRRSTSACSARAKRRCCEGIENARAGGKPAVAGAFTAIDPLNGEVLAIGSYPSFDPNKFAKPLTEAEYDALEGKARRRRNALTPGQPGGQRRLSDGLDVQADHGDGGARRRRDQPERGARRGARASKRSGAAASCSATPVTPTTAPWGSWKR